MEHQMKQYFDQKIKIDGDDEAAAGTFIIKTEQGLEFVSSKKKDTDPEERKN